MVWRDIKETIEDVCSTLFSSKEDEEKKEEDNTNKEEAVEDTNPNHNYPNDIDTK